MDIPLPSGNHVVFKDKLRPGDQTAVQDAPDVIVQPDRTIVIRNAAANTMPAFLARVIESWSFPGDPAHVLAAGMRGIDETMDLDDWNALRDAAEPLLEKVRGEQPAPNSLSKSPATGQQSEITSG